MSLYRKYRPTQFVDVVGQEAVVRTITEQLKRGEVSHAYLFAGPRGVGKTTMARLLARAVNCLERKKNQAEPCGACASCAAMASGSAFDVIEIDAASHTGVDDVREYIIAGSRVPPQAAKAKFFIIDEAHMLSGPASNALLKTLEEPPSNVIFVLATTELHKIPATIVSRCQRYDFRRVEAAVLKKRLEQLSIAEGREVESAVFDRVIALSGGCVRDAESVLAKLFALDKKTITSKLADVVLPRSLDLETRAFLSGIASSKVKDIFALTDQLERDGVAPQHFIETLIDLLGSALRSKAEGKVGEFFPVNAEISAWVDSRSLGEMHALITAALQALEQVKFTPNSFLSIELFGVLSCAASPKPPSAEVEPLQKKVEVEPLQKSDSAPPDTLIQWKSVVSAIRKQNHALATFLKFAEPEISDQAIMLTFRYRFYHDRVALPEHITLVERTIVDVFALPLKVGVRLEERATVAVSTESVSPPDTALHFALQAFGGEVIES